jgi:adenylyltransferase/sulfurtransferase
MNMEITPQELKRRLDSGEPLRLIDVREPFEHQIARIGGSELIPLDKLPGALPQLQDQELPLVLYCHHGVRSLRAAGWLISQGIGGCVSLAGGIERWSREVDSSIPRY